MLCALSVVIMLAGSVIEVMDLSVAAICSFLIIYSIYELGGAYPALVFLVSGALGMILLPNKLPALYYALFFGWYPMLKQRLDTLRFLLSLILKLAVCAASLSLILLASALFFPSDELVGASIPVYAVCLCVFVLYDAALGRITAAYLTRFKGKITRLFKGR